MPLFFCSGRPPDDEGEDAALDEKYTVQDHILGQGSKGGVRPATCKRTGRSVAVKTYVKAELSRQDMQNMRVELKLHLSLAHPAIVEVFDVIESRRKVHIIMEHLTGGELFEHVQRNGPLGEQEAVPATLELLRALAYLHARRIVHRDMKMENIIFAQPSGPIKLIDFGLAGVLGAKRLTQSCGTLGYAAPEVLRQDVYNESVDIWSLGAVCYSMLTGHALFDGDDEAMFTANATNSIKWSKRFSELPNDTQSFLRLLLSTSPEARPSALLATRHPWLRRVAPEEAARADQEAMQTATDALQEAERRVDTSTSSWGLSALLGRQRQQPASSTRSNDGAQPPTE